MDHIIQKAISQLLLNKAQQALSKPYSHYIGIKLIATRPEDCKNNDFECLSTLTDISVSTLKRFLKLSSPLNYQNKEKMLDFMEYTNWDTLVQDAVCYIEQKVAS